MLVVVNTSPLIALDRIGKLELLREMYGTILRPQSVLDELNAGRKSHDLCTVLQNADWIITRSDPPERAFRKELGAGETAVIALAITVHADLVVLDDLQARLVAVGLGLSLTGNLGVLLAAHRIGLLPDIREAVRQLQESGFRLSAALVDKLQASQPS